MYPFAFSSRVLKKTALPNHIGEMGLRRKECLKAKQTLTYWHLIKWASKVTEVAWGKRRGSCPAASKFQSVYSLEKQDCVCVDKQITAEALDPKLIRKETKGPEALSLRRRNLAISKPLRFIVYQKPPNLVVHQRPNVKPPASQWKLNLLPEELIKFQCFWNWILFSLNSVSM